MPCAFWLTATLPPPWSWPQAHWLSISLGYFPGTLPYHSSRRNARCLGWDATPHTIRHKNICILHLAKIIYYTSNSHPSTNTFVNTTKWNSKKKVILPPKKYDLFSILDSSWLFQTEEFNVCTICTIRTHAITTNRTHCCLLLSWGRVKAAVAQCGCYRLNPYCGVCYTSVYVSPSLSHTRWYLLNWKNWLPRDLGGGYITTRVLLRNSIPQVTPGVHHTPTL